MNTKRQRKRKSQENEKPKQQRREKGERNKRETRERTSRSGSLREQYISLSQHDKFQ